MLGIDDNGNIIITDRAILHNKDFKAILRRDRGSTLDPQGRNKLHAFREYAYIYYSCHPKSKAILNGYSIKDRQEYATHSSGLPSDYIPDGVMQSAIEWYRDEYITTQEEIIIEMGKSLRKMYDIVEVTNIKLDTIIKESKTNVSMDLAKVIELQTKVFDLATKIPTHIENFESAIEKLKKKVAAGRNMRGKARGIPNSANIETSL